MGLIPSWSHKGRIRLWRWKYLVEEKVWLRLIACDDGVRRAPFHEVIFHDRQEPLRQGKGIVVFLHAKHPRPIRDGPMQRQCWRVGRLDDYEQEAA